jgi:crossover junction endodeoxyribonuclease RuvC
LRVLGIDPGTALLGYGIVHEQGGRREAVAFGVLRTGPEVPAAQRLLQLHQGIADLLAAHQPDVVAVEELFFSRNVTSALAVGQARGVVLLAAAQAGLPVAEYKPAQVKQAVAGYGKAEKPQVQQMVRMSLGLTAVPKPDDTADALAVALCCLQSWRMERRMAAVAERATGFANTGGKPR